MLRRLTLCLSLGLLSAVLPAAQAQQVEAYVSADSVTVGERFTLSIVATHAATEVPTFPEPIIDDSLFGDLEVISQVARESYLDDARPGVRVDSVVYEVATFALDTAFVPSIPVRFSADADSFLLATAPLTVGVRSLVPPDAAGIRDLAPLAEFPRPVWPYVLLALGVLIAAALLWYYLRSRKNADAPTAPVPSVPEVTPYEEALRRLQALERTELADPATVKPFYVELSELLRTYLERRLDVGALEMTTRELVTTLRAERSRAALPREVVTRTKWVLDLADLAKFADVRPEAEQGRQALSEAKTIVQSVEGAVRTPGPEAAPADGPAPSTNGRHEVVA